MSLACGTRLGPYEIIGRLGAGGMGEVYRATDTRLARDVAVKVLPAGVSDDPGALARFEREARAIAALSHPNILAIYDVGREQGVSFAVTELLDGRTLRARLGTGALSPHEAVGYAQQLAEGLAAAHERRLIHRDLKPENVFITHDGRVKLLDFGLAKRLERDETEAETRLDATQAHAVMGTLGYMSPEQVRAEPADARSDIFAMGVVLHEMLSGERAFTGQSVAETMSAVLRDEPPTLSRMGVQVPSRLEEIVRRCLRKNPAERFQSARELASALATVLDAGGESASTAAAPESEQSSQKPVPAPAADALELSGLPLEFAATPHTVGRREVIEALSRQLDTLQAGGPGRLVCVTGEAGIGKTTVAENFLSGLSRDAVTIARGRCSERLAGAEAYLPLLEALESLLRGANGSTVGELMRRTAPSWYQQLHSQYVSAIEPGLSGASSQERLKRELALFYEQLSRDRPFVLFLEDLHWADVSTVDVLTYVADRFDRARALVLVTYRPEDMRLGEHTFLQVRPTLEHRGMLTEIPLRFLRVADVERFLSLELPGGELPGGLAELIHAKTEGSPLFMVDLVRDLRRRGVLAELEGRWVLTESLQAIERDLPRSIRSMIGRKIELLDPTEHSVLLAASVQGEEFDAAVVARALGTDPIELEQSLEGIEEVHAFVTRRGEQEFPDGTVTLRYRFVHVLYQNTLYAALTPAKRASLSRAVARSLESHYPEDRSSVAAALALLYEAARDPKRAAEFFLQAARHASKVFAHHEVAHLARRGIETLGSVPKTRERARAELEFRTILAPALMTISGWAAPEAEENNRRAEALCREVGDDREIFGMLCGLLAVELVRGHPERARAVGEEAHELAVRLRDPVLLLHTHYGLGDILTVLGELASARRHYEAALDIWHGGAWDALPLFWAQHPASTSLAMGSWPLALLGRWDEALDHAREGVGLAHSLAHPFSIGFALDCLSYVHELRGELSEAREVAGELVQLGEEHGIPFWLSQGSMTEGRLEARDGSPEAGLRRMQEALAMQEASDARVWWTRSMIWIAEALAEAGRVEEGLEYVERGCALVTDGGLRLFLAELHRARGDLLRLLDCGARRVEDSYRSALDVARNQGARTFELRAAVSLGRHLRHLGRTEEAAEVLRHPYEWFTESSETADLRDARDLIRELTR